jgi:hypothetical protein
MKEAYKMCRFTFTWEDIKMDIKDTGTTLASHDSEAGSGENDRGLYSPININNFLNMDK